jgi:hypothetical protein
MTGEMFLAYVKQCLFPTLRPNDIVVTDNCQVHLVAGIRETIEKARAILQPPVRICAGGRSAMTVPTANIAPKCGVKSP